MKRSATAWFAAACLALAFGSISLAAQQRSFGVAGAASTDVAAAPAAQPSGCPVSMRAQHLADGGMVKTRTGRFAGVGQRLHLALAETRSGPIEAATITIHGYSNKARITQALSNRDGSDAARTMAIQLSAEPSGAAAGAAAGDLWVPGMTAVQTIDLNSVTYANGSVRVFTAQQACRVEPDPLMLIAGR